MSSSIYNNLFRGNQKIFALLIDPENQNEDKLIRILEVASTSKVDMILVGGSLTSRPVDVPNVKPQRGMARASLVA